MRPQQEAKEIPGAKSKFELAGVGAKVCRKTVIYTASVTVSVLVNVGAKLIRRQRETDHVST